MPTLDEHDESCDQPTGAAAECDRVVKSFSPGLAGFFAIAGFLLPIVSLGVAISLHNEHGPYYASGLNSVARMLHGPAGLVPLIPLVAYSMISGWLYILHPQQAIRWFLVRLGVYSGILVWAYISVVSALTWTSNNESGPFHIGFIIVFHFALSAGFPILAWRCFARVAIIGPDRWNESVPFVIAGVVSLAISIIAWGSGLFWSGVSLLNWIVCVAYVQLALEMRRVREAGTQFSLAQLLLTTAWIGAATNGIRTAFQRALEEYSQLPPPPQGCYVCTAAARGHAGFVGSIERRDADGKMWCVNRQMVILKAGELILKRFVPRFHRFIRCIYDWLGPRLARRISTPLLADVAWLALKPFECMTAIGLRAFVGRIDWWTCLAVGRNLPRADHSPNPPEGGTVNRS